MKNLMRRILDKCGYKGSLVKDEDLVGYFFYKMWFTLRPAQIRALFKSHKMDFSNFTKTYLPIDDLILTHPARIWDPFDFKIRRRLKLLKKTTFKTNEISQEFLQEHLPSVDNIRVVLFDKKYYVSDGNGRVKCLKLAHPGKMVEVDLVVL